MISSLRQRAFRLTPQRVELVRLIAASRGHPSAAQLYLEIKSRFPTISPATVYKTLALLKELNQVLEIDLRDDRHYDGNHPEPHPHLICTNCQSILDAGFIFGPGLIRQVEHASGYQVLRQQITFYGLCPECRANQ